MKRLFSKAANSWYFKIGLLGLVLRLVMMPITAHSDIWALGFGQYFFTQKKVFNIYDYLYHLPLSDELVKNYGTNFYTYPPLAYFTLGLFGLILRPLADPGFGQWLVSNFSKIYSNPQVFRSLFLLKLPYLVFDLGTAFLLTSFFKEEKKKKAAFLLWVFNPLALYTSFMVGQFDIIPVFLIVLSLYFALKNKKAWAAIVLGVGGALKMFPLFFLPPLILILGQTFKEKMKLAFLGVAPYFLSIAPFLGSIAFRQVVLFSSQSQKMLFMILPLSGAEGIFVFAFFYFLICFAAAYFKRDRENFWFYPLMILLLFFSVTHYHPQWFLWLTPFLILELVTNNFAHKWLQLTLLSCFLVLAFFFEPSLHLGLFVPLNPSLANLSGGLEEVVSRFYDPFQLKSLVRSLFAAAAVFLIYLNITAARHHEKKTS